MNEETPLLQVIDLHTQFLTTLGIARAVDGVSLHLYEGEVLGLVGESGCGKSVTALSILGLVPSPPGRVVRGQILYRGRDLLQMPPRELQRIRGNEISMIFQDPSSSLNPYMTVGRQIAEVLELHRGMTRGQAREEGIRLLGVVGIPDAPQRFDDHPHEFSGGMAQRVLIAMALACDPALVIADEPTSSLDVTLQSQILELLGALRAKSRTSVLLISHDLGVVAGLADRVVVMYAGRVVEEASTEELFSNPLHPYTGGLLRAIPRLDGEAALEPIRGRPPRAHAVPGGCPFRPRCGLAHEACAAAPPTLDEVDSGHRVACWAVEGGP